MDAALRAVFGVWHCTLNLNTMDPKTTENPEILKTLITLSCLLVGERGGVEPRIRTLSRNSSEMQVL